MECVPVGIRRNNKPVLKADWFTAWWPPLPAGKR